MAIAPRCKKIIRPTYLYVSYKCFIEEQVEPAEFSFIPGKIPCVVAIILKTRKKFT